MTSTVDKLECAHLLYAMTHVVRYHQDLSDRAFASRMLREFVPLERDLPSLDEFRHMKEIERRYYASGDSPGQVMARKRSGGAA